MKIKFTYLFIVLTLLVSVHPAAAQNTTFTYQGRVQDNGTNFNGPGLFKFALVTSTNASHTATATANAPSGGYITGYTVTFGGNGYTGVTVPMSITGGGGSGAAAHANISGGKVTSVTVDNPGNGQYSSAPTVAIALPPANIAYTTYWSNDGTSVNGSEPSAAVNVTVSGGLFTVVLGDPTQPNMATLDVSLFMQPDLELRLWFDDGINGSMVLNPVQNLTPAPYAIVASTASSLVNGRPILQNTNGAPNIVAGSPGNFVPAGVIGATIAGGGNTNYARTFNETNSVTANFGTVGGGERNIASSEDATVGGGFGNTASGGESTVSGGAGNVASGVYDTVVGGQQNTASGGDATAVGGYGNVASGSLSFAAGYEAQATHYSSFVWSDYSGTGFSSTAANQFSVRASGGIVLAGDVQMEGGAANYHHLALSGGNSEGFLFGSYPYFGDGVHLGYNFYADANGSPHVIQPDGGTSRISADYGEVVLAVGSAGFGPNQVRVDATLTGVSVYGTFNNNSDRNAKQDFAPVSASQILDKVLQLPVSEWSYKEDSKTRHIGPVAQDFHAVFNIGTDDKHIAPIDEGGIAFAAIQGLNHKVEYQLKSKDTEIQDLKQQNDALAKRLDMLELALKSIAQAK